MLPPPVDLPRWQAELEAAFGRPNEYVSWLRLVWHGDPGEARLVIYQMVPQPATSAGVWGPDQKIVSDQAGHEIPDPRFVLDLHPELLSTQTWQLFQETGCYGQPFWIIQGRNGGHKRRFSKVEGRLLKATGHPTGMPPALGDLPYAPFDQRVLAALAPLDRMRTWTLATSMHEADPALLDAEERKALADGQREVQKWLAEQIEWAIDDVQTWKNPLEFATSRDAPDAGRLAAEMEQDIDAEYAA